MRHRFTADPPCCDRDQSNLDAHLLPDSRGECLARSNPSGADRTAQGFWCTLPEGHDGEHVAGTGGNGGVAARWPQDDSPDTAMSDTTINGERLSWRELAEHQRERMLHLESAVVILSDLDRCEHGRHEGDPCGNCGGPSRGNPLLPPCDSERFTLGREEATTFPILARQVGFDLAGRPIVVPDRGLTHRPEAWRR